MELIFVEGKMDGRMYFLVFEVENVVLNLKNDFVKLI